MRWAGRLLIIAALAGWALSIAGVAGVWLYRPKISRELLASLELARGTLHTTDAGLDIADRSVNTALASVASLQESVQATADTIDNTTPIMDSLATLTKDDLPAAIEKAQSSLDSAQQSALIIDNVLSALSALPGIDYNPQVPLHIALQNVSASLDPLPDTFITIHDRLVTTSDKMEIIQADVATMANYISDLSDSLKESQRVIKDYQTLVSSLEERVQKVEQSLPVRITIAAWILTLILVWVAITQFGLLLQGIELASPVARGEKATHSPEEGE